MKDMQFSVEIYTAEGATWLYLCKDGDSGCKYKVEDSADVAEKIEEFINDELPINY